MCLKIPAVEPSHGDDQCGSSYAIAYHHVEAEGILRDHQEGRAYHGHEDRWEQGDPEILLFAYQIDGHGPKGEDGQRLVGPAEVTPYHIETVWIRDVEVQQEECDCKQWDADPHSFLDRLLIKVDKLGNDQSG